MKITEKNRSEMQNRQKYDAPAIEIFEVNAEKGVALSPTDDNPPPDFTT